MITVDRSARARIAGEVRRFLAGETCAFDFDDAIFDVESEDPTVNEITRLLWLHYDDCKDHCVALTKAQWDYYQRLLLILESDSHIVTKDSRLRWRLTQVIALLTLIGFATCVWQFGVGLHLFVVGIAFGLVSMAITAWRRWSLPVLGDADTAMVPLSSFAELRATYLSVPTFRKTPYRKEIAHVRVRSPFENAIMWIPSGTLWLMFSPVILVLQMLPDREIQTRVVPSE